jgi:hypothetical protein
MNSMYNRIFSTVTITVNSVVGTAVATYFTMKPLEKINNAIDGINKTQNQLSRL